VKTLRLLLFLSGLGALAWGAWLFSEYAFPLRPEVFGTLGWLVGGTLVHDFLIAPPAGVIGFLLGRFIPEPWKTPVKTGAVLTGVLTLLAVPLLWRPYGVARNPGLHDADTAAGLFVTLAVVWLGVLLFATCRQVAIVRRRTTASRQRNVH
jgi:hypothetical protein